MKASPETVAWLEAYYRSLDALRADEIAGHFAEDVLTRYPGGGEVTGRDALMEVTAKSLRRLQRIHHRLLGVWEEEDLVIFELEVTYERTDGATIVRPGMGIFVMEDGRIREQRLFVDMGGVWD
jgi:ketosteroid isomerase-like protein